jgi:flagellar biosynthesis protein FlhG|tara:strand:+ start:4578 stop:5345 length:768 start_codon:yes stop_codon:yes gene_type:complete
MAQLAPNGGKKSQLLAVASGKGGVGKTWLSITLAHALARQNKKILLFDGDLGLANVDVQLGLAPAVDLGGVLAGTYDLKAATSRYEDGGFDVIAGRSGSGSLAALPTDRLRALGSQLTSLSQDYDSVLLDLGAGIDRTVRQLASLASPILVVCTDEPTSLTDAYAFIKLTVAQNRNADLRVVINMAGSKSEAERTYTTLRKACENFLKITPPLAGLVRRDSHVKQAIRAQSPLLQRFPNCDAAQDIEALAKSLLS